MWRRDKDTNSQVQTSSSKILPKIRHNRQPAPKRTHAHTTRTKRRTLTSDCATVAALALLAASCSANFALRCSQTQPEMRKETLLRHGLTTERQTKDKSACDSEAEDYDTREPNCYFEPEAEQVQRQQRKKTTKPGMQEITTRKHPPFPAP